MILLRDAWRCSAYSGWLMPDRCLSRTSRPSPTRTPPSGRISDFGGRGTNFALVGADTGTCPPNRRTPPDRLSVPAQWRGLDSGATARRNRRGGRRSAQPHGRGDAWRHCRRSTTPMKSTSEDPAAGCRRFRDPGNRKPSIWRSTAAASSTTKAPARGMPARREGQRRRVAQGRHLAGRLPRLRG